MKSCKFLLLTICLFFSFNIQGQIEDKKPLTIGDIRTFHSNILHEDRVLNIYLPEKYDSLKSYPVIYLLDGTMNEDFLHITGLVQFFNLMFQMPDCIIVGIANTDRRRDFTFQTDLEDLKKSYPTTGHSAEFIEFIKTELQPFISKNYNTNEVKYLIGQSLGGLLATEILLKEPELFSHYLIVSPSLWWDNESLLKNAKGLLEKQPDIPLYVYIAAGKGEDKIMIRDANDLKDILLKSGKKNLTVDFKLMTDDNHATILHNAIYQALLNLFPYKE